MSEVPQEPRPFDERVRRALKNDRTIDITTTGRRSGQPRRIEIWFHNLGGRIYISGLPGRRDWYANLVADPEFVFHLKETTHVDLPARTRPITDPAERLHVLHALLAGIAREDDIETWLAASPIVEAQLLEA
ncbi:MAG: nitroreductase/quinone reductase family protein [Solirubrobacteraceae bacterium]